MMTYSVIIGSPPAAPPCRAGPSAVSDADKVLHAGRPAEHRFQVREGGKHVEIRMHEREVFDVVQSPTSGQKRIGRSGTCP